MPQAQQPTPQPVSTTTTTRKKSAVKQQSKNDSVVTSPKVLQPSVQLSRISTQPTNKVKSPVKRVVPQSEDDDDDDDFVTPKTPPKKKTSRCHTTKTPESQQTCKNCLG